MIFRHKIILLSLPLIMFLTACLHPKEIAWMVYYGDTLTTQNLKNVELMIVEPDHINPKEFPDFDGLWIAYLSLGEVNESRPYFKNLKSKGAVIEANPSWPGAHRVDIRNAAWRAQVVNEIIPQYVKKGFHGVFFDTIDVASYLESKDAKQYAGSVEALVTLIEEIHKKFPQWLILPNNGLDFIQKLAPSVDGVVVEDLYTVYDEKLKKQVPASPAWVAQKEAVLDIFRKRYSKNIFVIHYGNTLGDELSKSGAEKAKQKGYQSYLSTMDLNHFGIVTKK